MKRIPLLFLVFLMLSPAGRGKAQEPFDHSIWQEFLQRFVNEKGEVDYQAVSRDTELLDRYLERIRNTDENAILDWPREEQLAFWLNVYHAGLIKLVVDHYPIPNIQQIPGAWDLPAIQVGESLISLNNVHADFLMGSFRDEKIHLALSCAAKSGPRLSREAYTGPRVEGQLYLATRRFVNDPERNKIIPGKKSIRISRLFKWYAADFNLDFGFLDPTHRFTARQNAVVSFLAYYSDDADRIDFLEDRNYKIKYLPFDWSLNDWQRSHAETAV